MIKSEIIKIIIKYLNKEANTSELDQLNIWLKEDENIQLFNEYVETHYLIGLGMEQFNVDKAKESIHGKIDRIGRNRTVYIIKRMSIAATILLAFGIFYYQNNKIEQIIEASDKIEAGTNRAILTLDNGKQVVLEKNKKYSTNLVTSNGEKLVYNVKKDDKKIVYNYLTIPRGGVFTIKLSDGTQVWLNSESKLKYPVAFVKEKPREVELLYGEAYFDVSHSSHHNGSPFNVNSKEQIVNVMGTEFNIKAYKGGEFIETTLIKGKVNISKDDITRVLKPNQQSRLKRDTEIIDIINVDVKEVVSWRYGQFSFNEAFLYEIIKTLSRWYNVDYVFESEQCKEFVFTGVLERTKNIEDILKLMEETSEGEVTFEITNKTIIVK